MNISVVIFAYNEEKRIANVLKSFSWAKEIIVFDKSSTDKTFNIASKYAKVFKIIFSEGSDHFKTIKVQDYVSCDWVLIATCSDHIDKSLANYLVDLEDKDEYDIINLPFKNYIFGIASKNSPWPITFKSILARKSVINYKSDIHRELNYNSNKEFKLNSSNGYIHHYSNTDIENFLNRSIKYAKFEGQYLSDNGNQHNGYIFLFKVLFNSMIRRGTIFKGKNYVNIIFAYIVCQALIYLYSTKDENNSLSISLDEIISKTNNSAD